MPKFNIHNFNLNDYKDEVFKKGIDEDWGERLVPYTLFLGGASLIFIVICGLNIETMVTGFINPEYGAIMDIINFVKH